MLPTLPHPHRMQQSTNKLGVRPDFLMLPDAPSADRYEHRHLDLGG
jgi:hypothetical protein